MDADQHSSITSMLPVDVPDGGENIIRPASTNYHPSVWGDYFIVDQQFPPSNVEKSEEWIERRVQELVRKVKTLLKECDAQLQEMQLIDAIQRLGVAYHFEKEIDMALSKIYEDHIHDDDCYYEDLHFVSLRFRLLRQHGYNVPSHIFSKFKDDKGRFKGILCEDAKGLLSLYEATFLSVPGEDILDDAANFAKKCLQSMQGNLSPSLAALVSQALDLPLRRRVERLEARTYIDIYQWDEDNRNDMVLELAKLDFHLLQLLHREEIKIITKWWKELGFSEKLSFARDRVVECYFWALAVYFEPQYSRARLIFTKVISFLSVMDDIYDAYGTVDELQVYTDLIQRWDLNGLDQLNESMMIQYLGLYDTFKDFENDQLATDQISFRVHCVKERTKRLCRAWLKEAQWSSTGYVPPLEEYLSVAGETTGYPALTLTSFVGMGETATRQAFEWMLGFPKILRALCTITRLRDDLVSHEREQKREHVASAIQCYMKEHGTSSEEACEKCLEMVERAWKELNRECLTMDPSISNHLLMRFVNLARVMDTMYKDFDTYTYSATTLKDYITMLLVQPILL